MTEVSEEFVERVGRAVARALLAATGQILRLDPDEPLWGPGRFDPASKLHLVLALQEEFGSVLEADDLADHDPVTIRAIARRLAARARGRPPAAPG